MNDTRLLGVNNNSVIMIIIYIFLIKFCNF